YLHPGERCLFPMRPEFSYLKGADSQKAIQHFLASLKLRPGDIETRWLLNLAYMTLGKYPAGVPKEHLLAPSHFASAEDIGRFTDVTVEAGLSEPTTTEFAAWVDINNDGFLDLYVGNENEPNQLFLNNGNGTFKDISRSSGTDLSVLAKAVVAVDYDNDGYAD